jgi:hypothetical protein
MEFVAVPEHALAEGLLVIDVARGQKVLGTRYAVQCDRGEDEVLRVVYLAKMRSEDGEVYGVEFARDGRSRCTCLGYRRHGRCKHDDVVRELLRQGTLKFRRL